MNCKANSRDKSGEKGTNCSTYNFIDVVVVVFSPNRSRKSPLNAVRESSDSITRTAMRLQLVLVRFPNVGIRFKIRILAFFEKIRSNLIRTFLLLQFEPFSELPLLKIAFLHSNIVKIWRLSMGNWCFTAGPKDIRILSLRIDNRESFSQKVPKSGIGIEC